MNENILEVSNLNIDFSDSKLKNQVVNDISFNIKLGEIVGIVGESGSGKTMTALAIGNLLPESAKRDGSIKLLEKELTNINEKKLRNLNGSQIGMVFQEPMTSLNPLQRIGKQVEEPLRIHTKYSKAKIKEMAEKMLSDVGLPNVKEIYSQYPHQLSGGMRQRVMIAIAMICEPDLLIADEPTTALDVTIQVQILSLFKKIHKEKNISILLISHDLRVIRKICTRALVMYQGKIVEDSDIDEIFLNPKDNYTKKLVAAVSPQRKG